MIAAISVVFFVIFQKLMSKQPNAPIISHWSDLNGKNNKEITIEGYLSSEWIDGGLDRSHIECWTWISEQPSSLSPENRYVGVNLGFYVVPEPDFVRRVRITGLFESDPKLIKTPNNIGGLTKVYNIELLDLPESLINDMNSRTKQ